MEGGGGGRWRSRSKGRRRRKSEAVKKDNLLGNEQTENLEMGRREGGGGETGLRSEWQEVVEGEQEEKEKKEKKKETEKQQTEKEVKT